MTDANRLEIRRLRADNPRAWTLAKLAAKFEVHRSTISHVLRRRMRVSAEQHLAALRVAAETSGPIEAAQVIELKHQDWTRQLLGESDLVRQQQLVNLIKSVGPLLEEIEAKRMEWRHSPAGWADDERRAIAALEADERREGEFSDSKPPMLQSTSLGASAA